MSTCKAFSFSTSFRPCPLAWSLTRTCREYVESRACTCNCTALAIQLLFLGTFFYRNSSHFLHFNHHSQIRGTLGAKPIPCCFRPLFSHPFLPSCLVSTPFLFVLPIRELTFSRCPKSTISTSSDKRTPSAEPAPINHGIPSDTSPGIALKVLSVPGTAVVLNSRPRAMIPTRARRSLTPVPILPPRDPLLETGQTQRP